MPTILGFRAFASAAGRISPHGALTALEQRVVRGLRQRDASRAGPSVLIVSVKVGAAGDGEIQSRGQREVALDVSRLVIGVMRLERVETGVSVFRNPLVVAEEHRVRQRR